MERRLCMLTVLVALAVPVAASGSGANYGVAIRSATVNRDRSITIEWSLENANVLNSWIAVDGYSVRSWSDRATRFTTGPLPGGWHTITIEVREMFETYAPRGGSSCEVSGGHWLCVQSWRNSTSVSVPYETKAYCVVPLVVGLQLSVAKAQIGDARCSLGAVKRVHSERRAGTVLVQRPKTKKRLPNSTPISLVVSNGHPPTEKAVSTRTD